MNNSKIRKMLFFCTGITVALMVCMVQSNSGWAMGGKPGSSDPAKAIQDLAQTFIMNPPLAIVQDQFNNAKTPLFTRDADGSISFTNAIALNRRYDCRVFYALSRESMVVKPNDSIWYQFSQFSDVVLDNVAYKEFQRIPVFAPHYLPLKPEQNTELWGQSTPEGTYYEAIRVKKNGDLLIVGFSQRFAWIRQALGIFNMDSLAGTLLGALKGFMDAKLLAFPWDNLGQVMDGLILGYGVCPKNPDPLFHMIGDDAAALKYLDEQAQLQ